MINYSISISSITFFAKTTLVYHKITLGTMDLYLQMAEAHRQRRAAAAFCYPASWRGQVCLSAVTPASKLCISSDQASGTIQLLELDARRVVEASLEMEEGRQKLQPSTLPRRAC
jgi:hypothetical protein